VLKVIFSNSIWDKYYFTLFFKKYMVWYKLLGDKTWFKYRMTK